MSNYNKNLFVGLGGKDAIDLSHFIGACYGMERMMGKADNPLRRILNRAADDFLQELPLVRYVAWKVFCILGFIFSNDCSGTAREVRVLLSSLHVSSSPLSPPWYFPEDEEELSSFPSSE